MIELKLQTNEIVLTRFDQSDDTEELEMLTESDEPRTKPVRVLKFSGIYNETLTVLILDGKARLAIRGNSNCLCSKFFCNCCCS